MKKSALGYRLVGSDNHYYDAKDAFLAHPQLGNQTHCHAVGPANSNRIALDAFISQAKPAFTGSRRVSAGQLPHDRLGAGWPGWHPTTLAQHERRQR